MDKKPTATQDIPQKAKTEESADRFKEAKEQLKNFKDRHLTLDRIFAALIASFLIAYIYQLLTNSNFSDLQSYYNSISFPMFFVILIASFAAQVGLTYATKAAPLIPWTLLISTIIVSTIFSRNFTDSGVYFIIGLAIADLVVVLWLVKDDRLGIAKINISYKAAFIVACALFVITTVLYGYFTSLRYLSYSNATFDFGIFTQMFENMAKTFRPETTVERSYLMSHFGVHFSPFFYLLLPGYFIFRSPLYLCYVQASAVAAGVFAVYMISRRLGLSGKMTLAFELIYTLYPSMFGGTFYDFHENKFLTVVILWLFYFIIANKTWQTFAFSLMLLSIKEDAAIYLIVIGLFVMINRKKIIKGALMVLMAILYFIIANNIVASFGEEGVMMWRLSDYFVNGEQSYFSVLKSIIFDIGFLFKQMFTADKFPFLIWMLLPVMFAPFMTKKISSLILLLPIIPINLMQSWQYQYDITYQYTYGVGALIIMCAIFAVLKLRTAPKRVVMLMSICMCILTSAAFVLPKISNNSASYKNVNTSAKAVDQLLEEIPEDASVTADHYIAPHLYYISELRTVPDYYKPLEQTDYYVVNTGDDKAKESMVEAMGDSYELKDSVNFKNGEVQLWQKK
ncbi:MAG: DUF2079 domain-containing protein [Ruminococcus sp.]|nr:DUF2079 domain-containing protein [Ruminococcus sp.]